MLIDNSEQFKLPMANHALCHVTGEPSKRRISPPLSTSCHGKMGLSTEEVTNFLPRLFRALQTP
jgi:hypothetical protein